MRFRVPSDIRSLLFGTEIASLYIQPHIGGDLALLTGIAKRIEDGLRHMIQAISACPTTIAEILDLADRVQREEMRIDEVVDGLLDPNAEEIIGEEIPDEQVEEELDAESEDEDGAAVQSASLLQLKAAALERFAVIGQLYARQMKSLTRHGSRSKPYLKTQEEISRELMMIRFSAKQIEALCESVRRQVDEVRSFERAIMELCVEKAGMPRAHFIKVFPGNEEDLDWVLREVA